MHDHLSARKANTISERIARLVVHRPFLVIGMALLVLGSCAYIISSRQRLDSEVLNLLPPGSEAVQALKTFNAEFRQGKELIFALHGEPADIEQFEEHFVERLREQPWVQRVFSGSPMESPDEIMALQALLPQMLLNLDDQSFQAAMGALKPDAVAQRIQRIRSDLEASSPRAEMEANVDPLGVIGQAMRPMSGIYGMEKGQILTSKDGTLKLFPVVTKQQSLGQAECKELMRQVDAFRDAVRKEWTTGSAPEVIVTGRSAYVAQIAHSMERDVGVTSLISILTVTGLFFVGFRRLIPPLATTVILSLSCFVAFTIGCVLFENLNMIAIAFCSILVGLGDDFSLLLYNRYLLARTYHEDHEQAVATSISDVGKGIVWVAVTTGAGFLVLLFSGSSGFAQLGTLIAIGVVLCGIFVIVLLFLFIRPQHAHPERPDPLHALFDRLVKLLLHVPARIGTPMIILAVAALVYAVVPMRTLEFDTNPRSLEPKQIPASIALRTINEKIPAASEPIALLLDSPDAETAHRDWNKLEQHLAGLGSAGVIQNFSSPAALMLSPDRLSRHGQELKQFDIEASREALRKALADNGFQAEAFESAFRFFDHLKEAATAPNTHLNFDGTLPATSSWWFLLDRYLSTRPLLGAAFVRTPQPVSSPEQQAAFASQIRASGVPVKITGWSYAMVGMIPWAKRELLVFSAAVGSLILICLGLAYRHWKPLLVHVLSLAFALGACVSLLKLTGTKINMLNALAFPLVLGVGVDYGMHLLLALKEGHTAAESLSAVVKPLVISGLTTIAGFGALMFAQNPALNGLGTVCAIGVASCLVASVFFAVPVMVLLGQPLPRKRS